MKRLALLTLFCSLATGVIAAPNDGWNEGMILFKKGDTTNTNYYRIPAITTTSQGTIIAVADYRHNGYGDIGLNTGVDFAIKISHDGGNTWSDKTIITPENGLGISDPAIVHNSDTGRTFLFGYQNDKFITTKPTSEKSDFFMYTSDDGGKTWNSAILRPENYPVGAFGKPDISSESNIFHHNGKIYLAAKPETSRESKKRVVYATSDNGKTWERVEEDFIPDDVAACESSSLSLNDKVYLVAYTKDKPERRTGVFLTTNTGKHLQIFDTKIDGYTSMSQDLDNLYIFHEGKAGEGEMLFRRFDISAKEYANINAQILNRGTDLLDVQDKLFASRSYLTGEYASQDNSGVEAVILNGNYKIGAFHKNSKENSKDVYRTIEYNTEDTTLVLSQDNVITNNDNIFAGYQYTKLSYLNGSKNDINSFVIGYSLNHKFENDFGYNLGINGIYSNNKLDRNEAEGLGKSASFDSYSISLKNEIYRDIKVQENTNLNLAAGLRTTYFGHDDIKEKNGNGFNDAYVDSSTNFSNEIYLKGSAEHDIRFNEKFAAKIGANVGYNKELMNVDDWRDKFTILDVEKEYARPVEKHSAGVANAGFHLTLDFVDKVETTLAYTVDSTGEGITTGRLTYKF